MYIGKTERGEIYTDINKDCFNISFEISDEESEKLVNKDSWQKTRENYIKRFEEIMNIFIP